MALRTITKNGISYNIPDNQGENIAIGVYLADILKALEACGDTSVLEALYPWLENIPEGKEILERKKAEAEATKHKETKPKQKEGKLRVGYKDDTIALTLTANESRLVKTLLNKCTGSASNLGSPLDTAEGLWKKMAKVGHFKWRDQNSISLPSEWIPGEEIIEGEE